MAQAAKQKPMTPEYLFVKWATPTEEAVSTVKLAGAYCQRRIATPQNVCIVVPNRIWATNIQRAAKGLNISVSLCIPQPETPQITQALDALAEYENEGLQGLSLVHRAGLDAIPELAHALSHVQGTETASELCTLIRQQLKDPHVAHLCTSIPVVLLGQKNIAFDYLFVVGCVEGLISPAPASVPVPTPGSTPAPAPVPASAPAPAQDTTHDNTKDNQAQKAFAEALESAGKRATISYFVKIPAELAEKLNLQVLRYKTENGTKMAMVGPSRFITEQGHMRPTTTGGQTLLRAYGLN